MYPRLRFYFSPAKFSCLALAYALILTSVTPLVSARVPFPSRNKGRANIQDLDKAVATPGAPAGKRMPDIDEARGRQHATPKAPPAIPSSRPKWSPPSSVPGRLIPPAVPVIPPVLTGNTELVGLAVNNQNHIDLDVSFAAHRGLLASAAQGFRDTLPQVYWSAAIPTIINEGYAMVFGTRRSDQLDHVVLERKGLSSTRYIPTSDRQECLSYRLTPMDSRARQAQCLLSGWSSASFASVVQPGWRMSIFNLPTSPAKVLPSALWTDPQGGHSWQSAPTARRRQSL